MKIINKKWGQVVIGQAENGSLLVTLENQILHCEYGLLDCGSEEAFEGPLRKFIIKEFDEDQVQTPGGDRESRIDAAAWRGVLAKAYPTQETDQAITVRLEWQPLKGGNAIQEITIFDGKPWLKIDYIDWFVNIVDIAHPGGTDQGQYQFYGAENWKRDYTFWENSYFCKHPGDIGYMNVTEVEDPTPLSYKGWFIMGVFNPDNGRGYGRVMPVEPIDIIKLLFEERPCGFELFHCYERENQPFSGYVFPVVGAAEGVISRGKQIVDQVVLK